VRWKDVRQLPCSVARALSVVGDPWTLLLVRDAFLGLRRFDQFEASLGLSPPLLAARLQKLVEEGVLMRRPYQRKPLRHEYRLTERGRDLYPVIASLLAWGDRWMHGGRPPPVRLLHRTCGRPAAPHLACSACGAPLEPREVTVVLALASPRLPRAPRRAAP
jgi:DNA-binding HxlR family transcriptional regulator